VDRHLKERLIGAAVLVAAAVILIPEMLTGPKDSGSTQAELLPSDAPTEAGGMKTYTIDLNAVQNQGSLSPNAHGPSEEVADTSATAPTLEVSPAPPPEEQATLQAQAESRQVEPRRQPEPVASASRKPDAARTAPTTTPPVPVRSAPVSESRTTETVKSEGDWAVQVASFGARATADRIAGELKAKGFKSYVMPVEAKGQTLYRVRVGPVADRAAAEALLKRVRTLHPNAAVVTQ